MTAVHSSCAAWWHECRNYVRVSDRSLLPIKHPGRVRSHVGDSAKADPGDGFSHRGDEAGMVRCTLNGREG